MKYIFTLAFLFPAICLFSQQWQQMNDYPGTGRDDGTVFTIENKVYCGLGMNAWFGCNSDFHVFDLETETWSLGTEIPTGEARQYANGFSHNGFGYVFGGIDGSGNYLNDLWKFDPVNNLWTSENDLPAVGRAGAVCFVIGDNVYFVGGKSASINALDEVWAYDLVNQTWTQKADFESGIWRGVAFSWDGKGIIGLGKDASNNLSGQFYFYSPEENTWGIILGLNMEAASYTAASQIGNRAFLYGGMNESGVYTNTFTRLDLETFIVHSLTNFPSDARRGGMAFSGDDEFYISTGVSSSGRLDETWKAGYVLSQGEIELNANFIEVFPNPAVGTFQLKSNQTIDEVIIYDLSGKEIFRKSFNGENVQIESNLPSGMYLMKVEGEVFSSTMKITFI